MQIPSRHSTASSHLTDSLSLRIKFSLLSLASKAIVPYAEIRVSQPRTFGAGEFSRRGAVLCTVGCLNAGSIPAPRMVTLPVNPTHLRPPPNLQHLPYPRSPRSDATVLLVPKFTFAAPLPGGSSSQISTWPAPSHQPGLNSSPHLLRKTFPAILPQQPTHPLTSVSLPSFISFIACIST